MLINIDDEKMRDIMREYYSNISKASKSYSSLGSQQDTSKMEDFGEVSGLQNISENQESLTKAMAIQANPKLEDGPSKSKDDTNGVRRFENVPYLDLLSETQRILIEQIGHCQLTIQEIEKDLLNNKLAQFHESLQHELDQQ